MKELEQKAQVTSSIEFCPSIEKLSAFYDSDSFLSEIEYRSISKHIQNCVICQEIIASYDELGSDLTFLLKIGDEKLLESQSNVKNTLCKELNLAPKQRTLIKFIQFKTILYRVAAVLAFAVMGYLIFDMKKEINSHEKVATNNGYGAMQVTDIPTYETPNNEVDKEITLIPNGVNLDDYQQSSYNSSTQFIVDQEKNNNIEETVIIANKVKHFWTLDGNLDALNTAFAQACDATHITETLDISSDENGFEVTINTSKSKLIALVRYLKISGLKLLSQQAPQPENTVFYGTGDDSVTYKAKFMASSQY